MYAALAKYGSKLRRLRPQSQNVPRALSDVARRALARVALRPHSPRTLMAPTASSPRAVGSRRRRPLHERSLSLEPVAKMRTKQARACCGCVAVEDRGDDERLLRAVVDGNVEARPLVARGRRRGDQSAGDRLPQHAGALLLVRGCRRLERQRALVQRSASTRPNSPRRASRGCHQRAWAVRAKGHTSERSARGVGQSAGYILAEWARRPPWLTIFGN